MDHAILQVVMRYIHIVSAVAAVGGLLFAAICLTPALRVLEEYFKDSQLSIVRSRFDGMLLIAIVGLVVSGAYNWYMLADQYKAMGPKGNALIGTKVLLAIIMFAVVGARRMGMVNEKAASMIHIHLAAIVILLGSILRYFRLEALPVL